MPEALLSLLAFSAGPLAQVEEGRALPTRLLICPWGETQTPKGLVICNATTAGVLMRNQALTKRGDVFLDFEHNTVPGSKTYQGEPASTAARGQLEVVPGEGIYLNAITWTPEGEKAIRNGDYSDVSPAIKLNDNREVIWVHSAGACKHGEMDALSDVLTFDAGDTINAVLNMGLDTGLMNWTGTRELLNLFLGLVGVTIPESSSYDQMKELSARGAKRLEAALAIPEAKAAALAAEQSSETDITTMTAEDQARFTALEQRVAAAEKEAAAAKKQTILDRATAAGKIVPFDASTIEALTVEQFTAACDKLEAGKVNMQTRGDGKAKTGDVETFSASDEEVMKTLGISKEAWKKANSAD